MMRTEILHPHPDERRPTRAQKGLASRLVEPELLDQLPPANQRAIESRRDLKRVNQWMGNARILAAAVEDLRPHRIVELGTGDGSLLLQVARRVAPAWTGAEVLLVDQHGLVDGTTVQQFSQIGCRPTTVTMEVRNWLNQAPPNSCDLMVANLFLHHFREIELTELLRSAARVTSTFVAVEPRRNQWALSICQLLPLIGCNDVTRHDAAVSVRAGFQRQEISRSWPEGNWNLRERTAGPFSHLFVAVRKR